MFQRGDISYTAHASAWNVANGTTSCSATRARPATRDRPPGPARAARRDQRPRQPPGDDAEHGYGDGVGPGSSARKRGHHRRRRRDPSSPSQFRLSAPHHTGVRFFGSSVASSHCSECRTPMRIIRANLQLSRYARLLVSRRPSLERKSSDGKGERIWTATTVTPHGQRWKPTQGRSRARDDVRVRGTHLAGLCNKAYSPHLRRSYRPRHRRCLTAALRSADESGGLPKVCQSLPKTSCPRKSLPLYLPFLSTPSPRLYVGQMGAKTFHHRGFPGDSSA